LTLYELFWPDDKTQKLTNIKTNATLTLQQFKATETQKPYQFKNNKTLLTEITENKFDEHEENSYSDFDHEGLITKMVSQEGPALAVGDVNNDGNEDFYIGGAKDQAGVLYLNFGNGK